MNIVKRTDWENGKKNNTDPYGSAIYKYAEEWADIMEAEITNGARVEDIARDSSHEADTAGLTGFMYGAAVSILSNVWKYGEALRNWHNLDTQIGNEGEKANKEGGVLNPALMTIGKTRGETK